MHASQQPQQQQPAAAADGMEVDDTGESTDASVHKLRPLLHKVWEAANAVLRRQAADGAELLLTARGFVNSSALHEWLEWGLTVADQPELLLQLVQFGRLLQELVKLVGSKLPHEIQRIIGRYVTRELSTCLLLRPGCIAPLIRLRKHRMEGRP